MLNLEANNEFINLELGGYKINNLPHQHDSNFMVGFMTKIGLEKSNDLILNGVIGVDSVFKLYFNTPICCYIVVSCDRKNICYPIAFGIFKTDSAENLSGMIRLIINKSKEYNNVNQVKTLVMIDKSPI